MWLMLFVGTRKRFASLPRIIATEHRTCNSVIVNLWITCCTHQQIIHFPGKDAFHRTGRKSSLVLAEARIVTFPHLLEHGVVALQVGIAVDFRLGVISAGGRTIFPQPVPE